MNIYHIWCDLMPGMSDLEFAQAIDAYLGMLERNGSVRGYRLTRRKLGFGPKTLGEFHMAIEVDDLAMLDRAFAQAASRTEPVEAAHHAVNHMVKNAQFALYRDFPDPVRVAGQERF
jgi:hypothetical protein